MAEAHNGTAGRQARREHARKQAALPGVSEDLVMAGHGGGDGAQGDFLVLLRGGVVHENSSRCVHFVVMESLNEKTYFKK